MLHSLLIQKFYKLIRFHFRDSLIYVQIVTWKCWENHWPETTTMAIAAMLKCFNLVFVQEKIDTALNKLGFGNLIFSSRIQCESNEIGLGIYMKKSLYRYRVLSSNLNQSKVDWLHRIKIQRIEKKKLHIITNFNLISHRNISNINIFQII